MYTTKLLFVLSIVLVVLSVAIGVDAQTVRPDRISFYNEPADSNKFESHTNYASGGPEQHKTYGVCEAGRVIGETLNLYSVAWTVEACAATTHQHLNLRWVEGCLWDMEHDPWARIDTYGSYGHATIVGHYDQGEVDLPIPTDTLSMTVVMSHTEGTELWTGNALFVFNQPIGCTSPPQHTDANIHAHRATHRHADAHSDPRAVCDRHRVISCHIDPYALARAFCDSHSNANSW